MDPMMMRMAIWVQVEKLRRELLILAEEFETARLLKLQFQFELTNALSEHQNTSKTYNGVLKNLWQTKDKNSIIQEEIEEVQKGSFRTTKQQFEIEEEKKDWDRLENYLKVLQKSLETTSNAWELHYSRTAHFHSKLAQSYQTLELDTDIKQKEAECKRLEVENAKLEIKISAASRTLKENISKAELEKKRLQVQENRVKSRQVSHPVLTTSQTSDIAKFKKFELELETILATNPELELQIQTEEKKMFEPSNKMDMDWPDM